LKCEFGSMVIKIDFEWIEYMFGSAARKIDLEWIECMFGSAATKIDLEWIECRNKFYNQKLQFLASSWINEKPKMSKSILHL
jgi:hypothetical protein